MPRFNDGGVSIPPWCVGEGRFGEGFRENVWVGVGVIREAGLCVAVVGARGTIGCGSDFLLTGGKNCCKLGCSGWVWVVLFWECCFGKVEGLRKAGCVVEFGCCAWCYYVISPTSNRFPLIMSTPLGGLV